MYVNSVFMNSTEKLLLHVEKQHGYFPKFGFPMMGNTGHIGPLVTDYART